MDRSDINMCSSDNSSSTSDVKKTKHNYIWKALRNGKHCNCSNKLQEKHISGMNSEG
uniref:Uncharacterized protein n=1 Tax=Arion vulgaris TaxID=1028688 RepID=A0A0B7BB62_9EUPU